MTTRLPTLRPESTTRCASTISASGSVRSTTGLQLPRREALEQPREVRRILGTDPGADVPAGEDGVDETRDDEHQRA